MHIFARIYERGRDMTKKRTDRAKSKSVGCHGVCGLPQSVPQFFNVPDVRRGAPHAYPQTGLASQNGGRKERKP